MCSYKWLAESRVVPLCAPPHSLYLLDYRVTVQIMLHNTQQCNVMIIWMTDTDALLNCFHYSFVCRTGPPWFQWFHSIYFNSMIMLDGQLICCVHWRIWGRDSNWLYVIVSVFPKMSTNHSPEILALETWAEGWGAEPKWLDASTLQSPSNLHVQLIIKKRVRMENAWNLF